MEEWHVGSMEYWNIGILVYWNIGTMEYWSEYTYQEKTIFLDSDNCLWQYSRADLSDSQRLRQEAPCQSIFFGTLQTFKLYELN